MGTPTLILLTGPGGSGKSTLAQRLAGEIGCPVISRDAIKEGMAAATPGYRSSPGDDLAWRTFSAFFASIELLLRAEVTLVAEAAFQHALWWRGLEPLLELAEPVVVRCQVSESVAHQRAMDRMAAQATRAAHDDQEHFAAPRAFDAIHLDAPTLDVDTTDGYRPGLRKIVEFCRR